MLQHDAPKYSPFLHCIYDEPAPTGYIGRGTHYSVVQALCWRSEKGELRQQASVQNVAIIWDEDHDERIIPCIEALHMAGLLYAIAMIGERKGGITIVLKSMCAAYMSKAQMSAYKEEVTRTIDQVVNDEHGDYWNTEFGAFSETPSMNEPGYSTFHRQLINDDVHKVDTYIRNIDNLWDVDVYLTAAEKSRLEMSLSAQAC